MATLEAELIEAIGVKPKKGEKRPDFLARLAAKADEIEDDAWEEMSEPAQSWVNAALKALNKKKAAPDIEEPEADEEEEDEAPKKVAKAKGKQAAAEDDDEEADDAGDDDGESEDADEDDEAPPPRKGKRAAAADDDDDDEPAPKKGKGKPVVKAKAKNGKAVADDDDDEDEAPKKKKSAAKAGAGAESGPSAQVLMRDMLINDMSMSVEDIMKQLAKKNMKISRLTVSTTRSGFLSAVKALAKAGKLKGMDV